MKEICTKALVTTLRNRNRWDVPLGLPWLTVLNCVFNAEPWILPLYCGWMADVPYLAVWALFVLPNRYSTILLRELCLKEPSSSFTMPWRMFLGNSGADCSILSVCVIGLTYVKLPPHSRRWISIARKIWFPEWWWSLCLTHGVFLRMRSIVDVAYGSHLRLTWDLSNFSWVVSWTLAVIIYLWLYIMKIIWNDPELWTKTMGTDTHGTKL